MSPTLFNAREWLADFRQASSIQASGRIRGARRRVGEETMEIVRNGSYPVVRQQAGGKSAVVDVQLPAGRDNVRTFGNEVSTNDSIAVRDALARVRAQPAAPTASASAAGASSATGASAQQVLVLNGDCVEAALFARAQLVPGGHVCVLNMASRRRPGGGFLDGAGAQEENLCRRSDLYSRLSTQSYPLYEFGGIYCRDVTFFRHSEARGYGMLQQPEALDVVSVAAKSHPELDADNPRRLAANEAMRMKRRMRAILNMAAINGCDAVVLSAFGCGAFCNPPRHVAELFREVLQEPIAQAFKVIIFAIIEDHNSGKEHNPQGNFKPFMQVFGAGACGFQDAFDAFLPSIA